MPVYNGYEYTQQPDGSWKRGNPVAPQAIQVAPGNPHAAPKAAAETTNTQVDAAVNSQTAPAQVATTNIGALTANLPVGYRWVNPSNPDLGVERIPGYKPPADETKGMSDKAIAAQRLLEMLDDKDGIVDLYDKNFAGGGIPSLNEYNPLRGANQQFDVKANAMLPFAKKLLRTPGEGAQSDKEAQDYRDQLPRSSFRDITNEQLITDLRNTALSVLQNEGVDTSAYNPETEETRGSAWKQNYLIPGKSAGVAAPGASEQSVPVDPEYQREYGAFLQQWAANPDPQAYVAKCMELDQKFGYDSDVQGYTDWANGTVEQLKQGGATVDPLVPSMNVPMGETQQFLNSAINNPVGAGLVGSADMLAMGAPSALFGDKINALGDANPYGMMAGQIAGSIGATSAIGKLGANTIGRIAPRLLGGGGKAQFGRDLATDVAYSGGYGGMTGDDVGSSMLAGGTGSIAGNAVGKTLGTIATGAKMSPAGQYLASRNIPMTIGQKLGGFAKSVEDRMAGMPIVGDMVNNRRLEGLGAFNREAFREAGERIGHTTQDVGKEGVQELLDAAGGAYDSATAGVNVPLDAKFGTDISALRGTSGRLPPDAGPAFSRVMDNYITPIEGSGSLTGDIYQNSIRALKGKRNKPPVTAQGFEQEWKDSMTGGIDALAGQMQRGGGQQVVDGLSNADAVYRSAKTLDDAVTKASGGSMSGESYIFTPSQLQRAGQATSRKYPGQQPFETLADYGQEVLPSKVPDSGTAGRLAQIALGGSVIGAGTGAGALAGGGEGAQTGGMTAATLTALLALGGTRGGQKALDLALISRPQSLDVAGQWMKRNRGLFGSAGIPIALNSN